MNKEEIYVKLCMKPNKIYIQIYIKRYGFNIYVTDASKALASVFEDTQIYI